MVSLWKIAVKVRVGKLQADLREITNEVEREGFVVIGLTTPHRSISHPSAVKLANMMVHRVTRRPVQAGNSRRTIRDHRRPWPLHHRPESTGGVA
jgi:hypothetical protein